MSNPRNPDSPASIGKRPGVSHDSRADLGYATTKAKFHSPRPKASTFPYSEEVSDEDPDLEDMDTETAQKISNKISTPYSSHDSLMPRSADHLSLIGGNSRVGIAEAVAKGMVPFPGMYKKRVQSGGGANSPKLIAPGQYNRTGTYRGWSHAPVPADDIGGIDNIDDEHLEKVRNVVRAILKNNVREA